MAWLKACYHDKHDVSKNIRTCLNHFHPSVLIKSDGNKCGLKTGAVPTMHLTKSSCVNEEFDETKSLPRFVASQEDIDFVDSHEDKRFKLSNQKLSLSADNIASQTDACNAPQLATFDKCVTKANELK